MISDTEVTQLLRLSEHGQQKPNWFPDQMRRLVNRLHVAEWLNKDEGLINVDYAEEELKREGKWL